MFGRYDVHGGFVEQLLVGNSQLFAGDTVAIDNLSFEIHYEDGITGALEQGLVSVGGGHQRFDRADIKGEASEIGVVVFARAAVFHGVIGSCGAVLRFNRVARFPAPEFINMC